IEMQVLNVAAFEKRVIYNLSKTYANQLKSGQGYSYLRPVIALTITDFKLFENTEKIITRFHFRETEENFEYSDRELEMIFVELPKFKKKLEDLQTLTEKWIFFMKEAPSLELIPSTLSEIPEMEKALNIASRSNLSVNELDKLDKREMFLEDQRGSIILALQEGEEKGRVKGQKEGQLKVIFQILGRLGELSPDIEEAIARLSLAELDELVTASLNFSSLEDLSNWLRNQN
ncbi:MAG: Rpn family recombination-promoting nuclease/putative transposase, partial [Cyanobacteria bacterium SBLK]|nr:Rpn family recombination-promoting nuclease/putative transposase [Cyanobacteria bacterium SBLK]